MSAGVAWFDGQWGASDALAIPLSDRGLNLADGLFETVLVCSQPACWMIPALENR